MSKKNSSKKASRKSIAAVASAEVAVTTSTEDQAKPDWAVELKLSTKRTADWERYLNGNGLKDLTDERLLAAGIDPSAVSHGEIVRIWERGGKGFNERKLFGELRRRHPIAVPEGAAAVELSIES